MTTDVACRKTIVVAGHFEMTVLVFDPYIWKRYTIRFTRNYQPEDGGWFDCTAKSIEEAIKEFDDSASYFHHEGAKICWIEERFKNNRKTKRYYFLPSKGWVGSETWDEYDI